jgi:hypothetical protein
VRPPVALAFHRYGRARGAASIASEIERNVILGLAAADQQITAGRRLDWVRPVDDRAGNQPGLAVMTTSDAARPAHRHIARLGQFGQAVECRTPVDCEIGARKGYQRLDPRGFPRRIGRWVWELPRDCGDARCFRLARPEIPKPKFLGCRWSLVTPQACKTINETAHKRGRAANLKIRIGRDTHFLEHVHPTRPALSKSAHTLVAVALLIAESALALFFTRPCRGGQTKARGDRRL